MGAKDPQELLENCTKELFMSEKITIKDEHGKDIAIEHGTKDLNVWDRKIDGAIQLLFEIEIETEFL